MTESQSHPANDRWANRFAVASFGALVIIIAVVFFGTFASMVEIWSTTAAFTHGFFVMPLVVYLIWRERDQIVNAPVQPSWIGVGALCVLSLVWWAASSLGIQVLAHAAAVLCLPAAVVAAFGTRIAAIIRFPLAFMVFAVPAGEFMIPALIDFTARFSVGALSLLGIPVYQDGRFFYVPSGAYEVAKACSGLKFLIATTMIAVLAAHLYFHRVWKMAAFAALAVAAAVLANGLRATAVVLLLHFTELDIGAGRDHRFVGWVIYGLLIMAMIWVAVRFQDPDDTERASDSDSGAPASSARRLQIAALAALGLILGPLLEASTRVTSIESAPTMAALPAETSGWLLHTLPESGWRPAFEGYSGIAIGSYIDSGQQIDVAVIEYRSQRQGREITDATNRVADPEVWDLGNESEVFLQTAGGPLTVRETLADRDTEVRRIWYWYEVNGRPVSGVLRTKLAEAVAGMRGGQVSSTVTVVSVQASIDEVGDRQRLASFVSDLHASLRQCRSDAELPVDCRTGPELAEVH